MRLDARRIARDRFAIQAFSQLESMQRARRTGEPFDYIDWSGRAVDAINERQRLGMFAGPAQDDRVIVADIAALRIFRHQRLQGHQRGAGLALARLFDRLLVTRIHCSNSLDWLGRNCRRHGQSDPCHDKQRDWFDRQAPSP